MIAVGERRRWVPTAAGSYPTELGIFSRLFWHDGFDRLDSALAAYMTDESNQEMKKENSYD